MTLLPRPTHVALLCAALGALTGCGVAYQPSRTANFALDRTAEIDDDDVRKAFEARPQLPASFNVAYYSFDTERTADIEQLLRGLPGAKSVYRIPPLVVTGERRFDQRHGWQPPPEVSVKQLRLLAARARAEVLVVVDAGYRTGGLNPLAALIGPLVPMLFVPFLDNRVESYLEAFVIDTRNGFLYGHLAEDEKGGSQYATIYAEGTDPLIARQWATLRQRMRTKLGKLVVSEATSAKPPPVAACRDIPTGAVAQTPPVRPENRQ